MPSVIATISAMPASAASRIASAAHGGGTKIIVALAPVALTASAQVSKTGTPSAVVAAPAGRDAADQLRAVSRHCSAWNAPALPVMPWQITRVFLSTRMLMRLSPEGSQGERRPRLNATVASSTFRIQSH